jgi:hypothetical protein
VTPIANAPDGVARLGMANTPITAARTSHSSGRNSTVGLSTRYSAMIDLKYRFSASGVLAGSLAL